MLGEQDQGSNEPNNVVTTQPQPLLSENGTSSSEKSKQNSNLPDGLRELAGCTEIKIQQHLAGIDYLCCCNRPVRYSVYDTADEDKPILYIREVSDCMFRQCLGSARRIHLKITDDDHKIVANIQRPLFCLRGCCCCACTLPQLMILSSPGIGLARVRELRTCLAPKYEIDDPGGNVRFRFKTDCIYSRTCQWFGDLAINVYDKNNNEVVGQIVKKTWKNSEECLSLENDIIVRFLTELNISERLMLLGAAFLVDFNIFEDDKRLCC